MESDIQNIVQEIHDDSTMAALVVSGAASQALAWIFGVGGASRTVLEALVPYSSRAMMNYLGWEPVKYVSAPTAVSLAAAAFRRASAYKDKDVRVLGVSCTATIATDYTKRGDHECYIAVWDGQSVATYHLKLDKGARDRSGEEEIVSRLYLNALAEGCGIATRVPIALTSNEQINVSRQSVEHPIEHLLEGTLRSLMVYGQGAMVADSPFHAAILSGSFNPLHAGHEQLTRAAEKYLRLPVVYEMSVRNVDKPPLTLAQVQERLHQFDELGERIVLDGEPLFRDKAVLFPNCIFVLGYDTAARLVNPKYYGGGGEGLREALTTIRDTGCRFLVAGRLTPEGFKTLKDVPVPEGFGDLFEGIPEVDFRVDLSSSELRKLL